MKATMQLIARADGRRSKPFFIEMSELSDLLKDEEQVQVQMDDFVLVIAVEGEEEFSTAPLLSIENFIKLHDIEWAEERSANG